MTTKPKRVLGDGAVGDAADPSATAESTIQPGLKDTDEKAGATPTEQADAELKAAKKKEKS